MSKGLTYSNKIARCAFSMFYAPLTSRYIFLYFILLPSRWFLNQGNQVSSAAARNCAFCTTESEERQAGSVVCQGMKGKRLCYISFLRVVNTCRSYWILFIIKLWTTQNRCIRFLSLSHAVDSTQGWVCPQNHMAFWDAGGNQPQLYMNVRYFP